MMQRCSLEDLAPLTEKQREGRDILAGEGTHFLFSGGSRSGKTVLLIRTLVLRCVLAPGSSHVVFRNHFNHLKTSILNPNGTLDFVLKTWFPFLDYKMNKTDWVLSIYINGKTSTIVFGGLDDKIRTEKILGQEYSTIYLNECSTISYASRDLAITRLAENSGLKLKMLYDCNPPLQSHWLYKLFIKKQDPTSGEDLRRPDIYKYFQMNPLDNIANLPPDYIDTLRDMPKRQRERFLDGLFGSDVPNALWPSGSIKHISKPESEHGWQAIKQRLKRIAIGVDPSGCDTNEESNNDEIGIIVTGLLGDGSALVLADHTGYYTPATWGSLVAQLYDEWGADIVLGEVNYGGAMVKENVLSHNRNMNFKMVTASRGKHLRAEPQAAHYENGKVKHVGNFVDLENEMGQFSTAGYLGEVSPNRVDALVMTLQELMSVSKYRIGVI